MAGRSRRVRHVLKARLARGLPTRELGLDAGTILLSDQLARGLPRVRVQARLDPPRVARSEGLATLRAPDRSGSPAAPRTPGHAAARRRRPQRRLRADRVDLQELRA